jgi:hypothetical protein
LTCGFGAPRRSSPISLTVHCGHMGAPWVLLGGNTAGKQDQQPEAATASSARTRLAQVRTPGARFGQHPHEPANAMNWWFPPRLSLRGVTASRVVSHERQLGAGPVAWPGGSGPVGPAQLRVDRGSGGRVVLVRASARVRLAQRGGCDERHAVAAVAVAGDRRVAQAHRPQSRRMRVAVWLAFIPGVYCGLAGRQRRRRAPVGVAAGIGRPVAAGRAATGRGTARAPLPLTTCRDGTGRAERRAIPERHRRPDGSRDRAGDHSRGGLAARRG